jgi:hypothetical protein
MYPCTWLDLREPNPALQRKLGYECLTISSSFMAASVAGDCTAPGSAGPEAGVSCFDIEPGVGAGKYLTYYSSEDGFVLSAAQSAAGILRRPAPVPLLSDGGLARPWPTGEAQVAADALIRARLDSCAALEPEMLCALPAIHSMCPCCYEAGGDGCGSFLAPLSEPDAALAANLFHQAYFVLPLASKEHGFRLRRGPESRSRMYQMTLPDAGSFAHHAASAAHTKAALRPPPWVPTAELSRRALTVDCNPPALLSGYSIITEQDADISGVRVDTAVHIGGVLTSNPSRRAYTQRVRFLKIQRREPTGDSARIMRPIVICL